MLEKSRHFLGRLVKDLKIERDHCSQIIKLIGSLKGDTNDLSIDAQCSSWRFKDVQSVQVVF